MNEGVRPEQRSEPCRDSALCETHSAEKHGSAPAGQAEPFCYSGDELEALQQARNYLHWIVSSMAPHVGRRAAEIGAGIGNFAEHLLQSTQVEQLVLIEPAANLFPTLEARFADEPRVRVLHSEFRDCADQVQAETVILANVLEHVEDDTDLLAAIHGILPAGGSLLLFVPALPWLYGTLDKKFDHYRRYTRRELREKLERAGFRIERLRYFNLPGVAAWFLAGRILRQRTIWAGQTRFYDRFVIPWVSRLERAWEPPLGQSLLAVAKKGPRTAE